MRTSAAGIAFIEREEGVLLHLYKDESGLLTIGCGHLVRPGEDFSTGITQAQCDALLAADLRLVESCINQCVHPALTQNAFDACASLAFNIGCGGFATSTVVHEFNAGNVQAAADAFLLWDKDMQGGKLVVSTELLARRGRERALFLGQSPDAVA
jgi:lysozyme